MNEFCYGAIVLLGLLAIVAIALDTWSCIGEQEEEERP